jgi:hypothetical protein
LDPSRLVESGLKSNGPRKSASLSLLDAAKATEAIGASDNTVRACLTIHFLSFAIFTPPKLI